MVRQMDELQQEFDQYMEVASNKYKVVKFYSEEIEKIIESLTDCYSDDYVYDQEILDEIVNRLRSNLEIVENYLRKAYSNLSEEFLEEDE